jgi:hypothetical protein
MLRLYFLQQWFKLSDPALEDTLDLPPFAVPVIRQESGVEGY